MLDGRGRLPLLRELVGHLVSERGVVGPELGERSVVAKVRIREGMAERELFLSLVRSIRIRAISARV